MSDYKSILEANALPQDWDYNRLVHFARTLIPPAPALYMTRDDLIQCRMWNPGPPKTVNVSLRFQSPDGQIIPCFRTVTVGTVGTTPFVFSLDSVEGFLLSASVETPNVPRGQVFVQLEIQRGLGSQDATMGHVFLAGYPGSGQKIGFPQSPVTSPLDGRGWVTSVIVGSPAAGADWSITVPPGEQWILRSARALFTTSAAVGSRTPVLTLIDAGGNIVTQAPPPSSPGASSADNMAWANGYVLGNILNFLAAAWPTELRMQPGWILQTVTLNILAGDQWSGIVVTPERFISA